MLQEMRPMSHPNFSIRAIIMDGIAVTAIDPGNEYYKTYSY